MKKIPFPFIVASAAAWALFGCLTIQAVGHMDNPQSKNTQTAERAVNHLVRDVITNDGLFDYATHDRRE